MKPHDIILLIEGTQVELPDDGFFWSAADLHMGITFLPFTCDGSRYSHYRCPVTWNNSSGDQRMRLKGCRRIPA